MVDDDPTGEGYFTDETYYLEQDEEVVFEMHANRSGGYCDFRIEVDVLAGGSRRSTEIIDNEGEPFWVSGLATGWDDYDASYIGGVASGGDWRRPGPDDFFPGDFAD
ncbi:hypothetical protein ACFO4E_26255 [Nocardiopsis mangrovi]|uniref:Uncharacterized protein n=1 Tax=Nocardiopsis mangrovi TaxID=1179818 RepID=A0ABV9E493_9ACTN